MSKKLKFHFTEGHTHLATGVKCQWFSDFNFVYTKVKEHDGIVTRSDVSVPMQDVLYIEVLEEGGAVSVIPGLINSFTVVPDAAQVLKVQAELEAQKKSDEKYAKHKADKKRKNAQRKKEQYAKQLGITVEKLEKLETLHKK